MKLTQKINLLSLAMCIIVAMPAQSATKQQIYQQAIAAAQKHDYAKSFALLKPLADKGDATAQNNIAVLYQDGLGVKQSDADALKWYRKAALQGLADAQFMTGLMYAQGLGTQQDFKQAFTWYSKAAKQGHAEAQNNLAMRYASGSGTKRDIEKAKYWFGQAAMRGHATAGKSLQQLRELEQAGKVK